MSMDRRRFGQTVLGGLMGFSVLNLLEPKTAFACGEGQPPRRLVFVIEGCGMNYQRFTPIGIPNQPASEFMDVREFELPPMMAALSQHRDKLVLVDGLSNDQGLAGSGHSTAYAALSCVPNDPPNENGRPGGETIDIFLGRTMAHCTPFPNLLLAVGQTQAARLTAISATRDKRPVPHFCDPNDAYQQLFGAIAAQRGANDIRQRAVFELLRGDIERLEKKLSGRERAKLDQIKEAMAAIERREQSLGERVDELRQCAQNFAAVGDRSIAGRLVGHFDLTGAALACDLTRVVTIASGCGYNFLDMSFPELGLTGTKHEMGHGYQGGLDSLDRIHNFHAQQIANLCDRLSAIPEGEGTMMDNTLIVWTNENGEQHHAGYQRWPVALIGGSGLGLDRGRFIRFPSKGSAGARTLPDLWNSICHLMGVEKNDFGADGRESVIGPLVEISG
ncbi:MAG: DUF1552 domain-containing protein [Myxococcota bacterium]|nr:DUF1552 domain-containing protein [Myxococcota bacterium]